MADELPALGSSKETIIRPRRRLSALGDADVYEEVLGMVPLTGPLGHKVIDALNPQFEMHFFALHNEYLNWYETVEEIQARDIPAGSYNLKMLRGCDRTGKIIRITLADNKSVELRAMTDGRAQAWWDELIKRRDLFQAAKSHEDAAGKLMDAERKREMDALVSNKLNAQNSGASSSSAAEPFPDAPPPSLSRSSSTRSVQGATNSWLHDHRQKRQQSLKTLRALAANDDAMTPLPPPPPGVPPPQAPMQIVQPPSKKKRRASMRSTARGSGAETTARAERHKALRAKVEAELDVWARKALDMCNGVGNYAVLHSGLLMIRSGSSWHRKYCLLTEAMHANKDGSLCRILQIEYIDAKVPTVESGNTNMAAEEVKRYEDRAIPELRSMLVPIGSNVRIHHESGKQWILGVWQQHDNPEAAVARSRARRSRRRSARTMSSPHIRRRSSGAVLSGHSRPVSSTMSGAEALGLTSFGSDRHLLPGASNPQLNSALGDLASIRGMASMRSLSVTAGAGAGGPMSRASSTRSLASAATLPDALPMLARQSTADFDLDEPTRFFAECSSKEELLLWARLIRYELKLMREEYGGISSSSGSSIPADKPSRTGTTMSHHDIVRQELAKSYSTKLIRQQLGERREMLARGIEEHKDGFEEDANLSSFFAKQNELTGLDPLTPRRRQASDLESLPTGDRSTDGESRENRQAFRGIDASSPIEDQADDDAALQNLLGGHSFKSLPSTPRGQQNTPFEADVKNKKASLMMSGHLKLVFLTAKLKRHKDAIRERRHGAATRINNWCRTQVAKRRVSELVELGKLSISRNGIDGVGGPGGRRLSMATEQALTKARMLYLMQVHHAAREQHLYKAKQERKARAAVLIQANCRRVMAEREALAKANERLRALDNDSTAFSGKALTFAQERVLARGTFRAHDDHVARAHSRVLPKEEREKRKAEAEAVRALEREQLQREAESHRVAVEQQQARLAVLESEETRILAEEQMMRARSAEAAEEARTHALELRKNNGAMKQLHLTMSKNEMYHSLLIAELDSGKVEEAKKQRDAEQQQLQAAIDERLFATERSELAKRQAEATAAKAQADAEAAQERRVKAAEETKRAQNYLLQAQRNEQRHKMVSKLQLADAHRKAEEVARMAMADIQAARDMEALAATEREQAELMAAEASEAAAKAKTLQRHISQARIALESDEAGLAKLEEERAQARAVAQEAASGPERLRTMRRQETQRQELREYELEQERGRVAQAQKEAKEAAERVRLARAQATYARLRQEKAQAEISPHAEAEVDNAVNNLKMFHGNRAVCLHSLQQLLGLCGTSGNIQVCLHKAGIEEVVVALFLNVGDDEVETLAMKVLQAILDEAERAVRADDVAAAAGIVRGGRHDRIDIDAVPAESIVEFASMPHYYKGGVRAPVRTVHVVTHALFLVADKNPQAVLKFAGVENCLRHLQDFLHHVKIAEMSLQVIARLSEFTAMLPVITAKAFSPLVELLKRVGSDDDPVTSDIVVAQLGLQILVRLIHGQGGKQARKPLLWAGAAVGRRRNKRGGGSRGGGSSSSSSSVSAFPSIYTTSVGSLPAGLTEIQLALWERCYDENVDRAICTLITLFPQSKSVTLRGGALLCGMVAAAEAPRLCGMLRSGVGRRILDTFSLHGAENDDVRQLCCDFFASVFRILAVTTDQADVSTTARAGLAEAEQLVAQCLERYVRDGAKTAGGISVLVHLRSLLQEIDAPAWARAPYFTGDQAQWSRARSPSPDATMQAATTSSAGPFLAADSDDDDEEEDFPGRRPTVAKAKRNSRGAADLMAGGLLEMNIGELVSDADPDKDTDTETDTGGKGKKKRSKTRALRSASEWEAKRAELESTMDGSDGIRNQSARLRRQSLIAVAAGGSAKGDGRTKRSVSFEQDAVRQKEEDTGAAEAINASLWRIFCHYAVSGDPRKPEVIRRVEFVKMLRDAMLVKRVYKLVRVGRGPTGAARNRKSVVRDTVGREQATKFGASFRSWHERAVEHGKMRGRAFPKDSVKALETRMFSAAAAESLYREALRRPRRKSAAEGMTYTDLFWALHECAKKIYPEDCKVHVEDMAAADLIANAADAGDDMSEVAMGAAPGEVKRKAAKMASMRALGRLLACHVLPAHMTSRMPEPRSLQRALDQGGTKEELKKFEHVMARIFAFYIGDQAIEQAAMVQRHDKRKSLQDFDKWRADDETARDSRTRTFREWEQRGPDVGDILRLQHSSQYSNHSGGMLESFIMGAGSSGRAGTVGTGLKQKTNVHLAGLNLGWNETWRLTQDFRLSQLLSTRKVAETFMQTLKVGTTVKYSYGLSFDDFQEFLLRIALEMRTPDTVSLKAKERLRGLFECIAGAIYQSMPLTQGAHRKKVVQVHLGRRRKCNPQFRYDRMHAIMHRIYRLTETKDHQLIRDGDDYHIFAGSKEDQQIRAQLRDLFSPIDRSTLRAAYKKVDGDNSGTLDADEIMHLYKLATGKEMPAHNARAITQLADEDGSWGLSWLEFINLVQVNTHARVHLKAAFQDMDYDTLHAAFHKVDIDHSDSLSATELVVMYKEATGNELDEEHALAIVRIDDEDGDFTMGFQELLHAIGRGPDGSLLPEEFGEGPATRSETPAEIQKHLKRAARARPTRRQRAGTRQIVAHRSEHRRWSHSRKARS